MVVVFGSTISPIQLSSNALLFEAYRQNQLRSSAPKKIRWRKYIDVYLELLFECNMISYQNNNINLNILMTIKTKVILIVIILQKPL